MKFILHVIKKTFFVITLCMSLDYFIVNIYPVAIVAYLYYAWHFVQYL